MQNIINGLPIAAVILLLAVGFAFLVKGADFFVDGSSSIAKKLKVPPIIIGLTIVAMGTSLPETAVSVTASLVQNNELAVSNVVGSNILSDVCNWCLFDSDANYGSESNCGKRYSLVFRLCTISACTGNFRTGR